MTPNVFPLPGGSDLYFLASAYSNTLNQILTPYHKNPPLSSLAPSPKFFFFFFSASADGGCGRRGITLPKEYSTSSFFSFPIHAGGLGYKKNHPRTVRTHTVPHPWRWEPRGACTYITYVQARYGAYHHHLQVVKFHNFLQQN